MISIFSGIVLTVIREDNRQVRKFYRVTVCRSISLSSSAKYFVYILLLELIKKFDLKNLTNKKVQFVSLCQRFSFRVIIL